MAAKRNARQRPEFSARLVRAHKEICAAYRDALRVTGCTQAQAARGMAVTPNTAANYEHGRTPVNVARVLAYPRLRKAFRDLLCSYDHGHGSAPYIAKRRGSR
jgi:transcriptional regulator with XRE-family HTH domain